MRHLALFNGIGGFQLAAHWMGWRNIAHVENDPFCNNVVGYWFPESKRYEDVKEFAKEHAPEFKGSVDIITGGFPCQPFSHAGKRRGTDDDRHLWPEMLETVRAIAPRYVVGENVPGIVNWNGGMVFEEVCADLEAEGYEVQPLLLPAAGVGAPHRRERCWFVAHADGGGKGDPDGRTGREKAGAIRRNDEGALSSSLRSEGDASDTTGERLAGQTTQRELEGERPSEQGQRGEQWDAFPNEPPLCSGNDGFPSRMDGITLPKWRRESIKAYGNAIVPQVAFEIFKAIEATETETSNPQPQTPSTGRTTSGKSKDHDRGHEKTKERP